MSVEEASAKEFCAAPFNNLSMMETSSSPHLYLVGLEFGALKAEVKQKPFCITGQSTFCSGPCHVSAHKDCLCQSLYLNDKLLSAARKSLLEYTAGFMSLIGGFSTLMD